MRKKFTLSIDAELIERIKVQAVLEKRDVSTITEELSADTSIAWNALRSLRHRTKRKNNPQRAGPEAVEAATQP